MVARELGNNYCVEVDEVSKSNWSNLLLHFDDATIYQTWSYGRVRWGEKNLSHLVLKKKGSVVAAAQLRIVRVPIIGKGIAYLTWGPMWRICCKHKDYEILRQMLMALVKEYVKNRRFLLRIVPNERCNNNADMICSILKNEGFKRQASVKADRTFIKNITPSLEELKKGCSKKWRENLRRSQRSNLEILDGTDDNLYCVFIDLYKQMHSRKKFIEFVDINQFREIQKDLPDCFKMRIMICEFEKEAVAGLVYSVIGNTGIPIFSATGNKYLKLRGSYLLRWLMLKKVKEMGCQFIDQGGIDQQVNPGGYHFKKGMGGIDVSQIGHYESYEDLISYFLVRLGEQLDSACKKIRITVNRAKRKKNVLVSR